MKLARWQDRNGVEQVGYVEDGHVVACVTVGRGRSGDAAILNFAMRRSTPPPIDDPAPLGQVRLLAPVSRPGAVRDFYAFEQHVRSARQRRGLEMDADWYRLPVFYFTNPHTIHGPDDDIAYPKTKELDYELEVAAVVGSDGADLTEAQALQAIAGYTVFNDFSARDLQRREMRLGLGPSKGKDFASALGPYLVTPDELRGSPQRPAATMVARVNGEEWSRGELSALQHTFAAMIAHASRDSRVRRGDVIGSGTVGSGCILELSAGAPERYRWLQPGDTVELEVEGIGVLRNRIAQRLPGFDGDRE